MIAGTRGEYQPDARSTKDTPSLALTGELWDAFGEYFFLENWPRYDDTALYVTPVTRERLEYTSTPHWQTFLHHTWNYVTYRHTLLNISLDVDTNTLISAWISNYIRYNVWDEITYPFLNSNGCTVEVWDG